jgi:fibronectin-binding autotransporter adhesin
MKTKSLHSAGAVARLERSPVALRFWLAWAPLLAVPLASLQATSLYWDTNGVSAEAGAVPTGTWGTDGFWNSDATGGSAGSFTATTTGSDSLFFSAGPNSSTSAYTVTVSGTQSAQTINFQNRGVVSLSGGTINLGSGGIVIPRAAVSGNDQGGVNISSDISLQANQKWSSNMASSTGFVVSGNVTGTGNLSLEQLANRAFTLSGGLNFTGTLTSVGTNAAGSMISGNIGSNVTDVKVTTSAALILTGTNTYSGNTFIGGSNFTNPTLRVGSNNALATSTVVILSTGGTSASAKLDLGNGANSFNATVAGLSTIGSNLALNKVTNGSSGTGTATLTINPDGAVVAADNTFGGIIEDGATAKVALTKAGSHTLTLTGVNTYTGATRVEGTGTLALTGAGAISANSAITVAAGATFDTSAQSAYTFSTATVTTIGVGAATAGQVKAAAVTFSDASLAFDFGSASSLLASYNVLAISGAETGHFAHVTATGSSISGTFVDAGSGNWTLVSGGYSLTFSESAGTLSAVVSAVPEPSTFAVLAGSTVMVFALRRRRTAFHA